MKKNHSIPEPDISGPLMGLPALDAGELPRPAQGRASDTREARHGRNGFARAMANVLDDIRSVLLPESEPASDICIEVEEKTGQAHVLIGCTIPRVNEKLSGSMGQICGESDDDAAVYAHLAKTLVEVLGGEPDPDGPEKCAAFRVQFKTGG